MRIYKMRLDSKVHIVYTYRYIYRWMYMCVYMVDMRVNMLV